MHADHYTLMFSNYLLNQYDSNREKKNLFDLFVSFHVVFHPKTSINLLHRDSGMAQHANISRWTKHYNLLKERLIFGFGSTEPHQP